MATETAATAGYGLSGRSAGSPVVTIGKHAAPFCTAETSAGLWHAACFFAVVMKQLVLASCLVLLGCQSGGSETASDQAIAELRASQTSGYAVPHGAGGYAFTMSASMAAVRWAKLDEAQLRSWWQLWSAMQGEADCPQQTYHEADGRAANLFDRSPRDGFCVAFAQRKAGDLTQSQLVAFFDRI